jgi:hypothetical protein
MYVSYMVMGNALSYREAVSLIKAIVSNEEPLTRFEMYLREQSHTYM